MVRMRMSASMPSRARSLGQPAMGEDEDVLNRILPGRHPERMDDPPRQLVLRRAREPGDQVGRIEELGSRGHPGGGCHHQGRSVTKIVTTSRIRAAGGGRRSRSRPSRAWRGSDRLWGRRRPTPVGQGHRPRAVPLPRTSLGGDGLAPSPRRYTAGVALRMIA